MRSEADERRQTVSIKGRGAGEAAMNFPAEINGRRLETYIDWAAPTFLITLVSLPAASVPAGLTADRLPVGLQIVAPRFEEPRILRIAKLVQQANPLPWPNET